MTDFTLHTAPVATAFQQAVDRLDRIAFAEALWSRRLDIWPGDAAVHASIGNRLGWLGALDFVTPHIGRLLSFARSVRDSGLSDVVLMGMGGSSLAPEVLRQCLGAAPDGPRFTVLDSVDPDAVRRAFARASTTLFILASKSGSTIEPNTMAAEARRRVEAAGIPDWGSRFVAITDEGTPAHTRAVADRFRDIFVNPSDIGGRYSALSFFGLVPAALMGIDIEQLVSRARAMEAACRTTDAAANPGLALGAFMAASAASGRDKLTLLLPPALASFGLWVEQLVAESTGKQGTGVAPITGESAPSSYGADRSAVVVRLGAVAPDGADRLTAAGAPALHLTMPDVLSLGAEFLRWEVATAAAGLLLGINPFDEPNVQQAKDATRVLLQAFAAQGRLPIPEPDAQHDGVRLTMSAAARTALAGAEPQHVLRLVGAGDYVTVLAYLPPDDPDTEAAYQRARTMLGDATGAATMFGYGPRYLHSTGQLHKGGPNTGVFLVVTADAEEDLPIPGEPFSFGVLETAQAVGDFQSLDRTGRRALLVRLPRRDPALIERLATVLARAAGSGGA